MNRLAALALALGAGLAFGAAADVHCAEPAAGVDTLALSLADALARARAAAPRLRELEALAEAAGADARVARAARLPALDARAAYARWSDVPELTLALPGQPSRTLFPNLPDNWSARASLAWPLWTGGRLGSGVRAADRLAEAAIADADAATAVLAVEAQTVYWDASVARARQGVLAAAITAYERHLTDARNRQRAGMAARHEVLAVEVERDRAELARLRAAGDEAVAQADLRRLLDLPAATVVVPADSLPAPEGADEDLEALVAAALARRPERAAAAARAAAAEAAVTGARAGRLPQVALTANYEQADPNRRLAPPREGWEESWDVGVSVSLSVFDGGRIGAQTAAARARAEAARQRLAELDRRLRLEVTVRRQDLLTARAAAAVAGRALVAAGEARRVAGDRYREGLIPSAELLDAENVLLRAGLELTAAQAGVRVATAALDRAVAR
mgnify:FL=1